MPKFICPWSGFKGVLTNNLRHSRRIWDLDDCTNGRELAAGRQCTQSARQVHIAQTTIICLSEQPSTDSQTAATLHMVSGRCQKGRGKKHHRDAYTVDQCGWQLRCFHNNGIALKRDHRSRPADYILKLRGTFASCLPVLTDRHPAKWNAGWDNHMDIHLGDRFVFPLEEVDALCKREQWSGVSFQASPSGSSSIPFRPTMKSAGRTLTVTMLSFALLLCTLVSTVYMYTWA